MPNLPNNQIILDQSNRGTYPLEDMETWETGGHEWRSLQKDNPSYFHAIPHKDGKFSTHEHQANGHYHVIVNSSKITQQDSHTDGTTQNKQSQVGGGNRTVNGQGEHRERGADDTKAVAGSTIALSKSSHTHISNEHGHHGVKGDYGFYVKGGGYSIGAEQQVVVTSQMTMHIEAQQELSLKGIQNFGATTKGKMTFDSIGDMLANTTSSFTANAATSILCNAGTTLTCNAGTNMSHIAGQNISMEAGDIVNITAGSQIQLVVGGSTITMLPDKIIMLSAQVQVNHQQMTPTSNIFL